MKVKLSIIHRDAVRDVMVVADANATAASLASRIEYQLGSISTASGLADPHHALAERSIIVNPGTSRERMVGPDQHLGEASIKSGDSVAVVAGRYEQRDVEQPVGTLNVLVGPDAPNQFPLYFGTNVIGRDRGADVRLSDPLVSKRHAKLNISDLVEVVDDGSSNGVLLGGRAVDRAVLNPGSRVTIGDTEFTVSITAARAGAEEAHSIAFNRSPRLDPQYEGITLKAPTPPQKPAKYRFPVVAMIVPIMMGGMIYAVTRQLFSILFVAMSPLMMIGNYFSNRQANKKNYEHALAQYRSALVDLSVQLQYAADLERAGRRSEHPSAREVEEATRDLTDLVWTRRPEHAAFLTCRTGLGTQLSRNAVELPTSNDTEPALWRELLNVVAQFKYIDRVPIVARLAEVGNIGVAGPSAASEPALANVVGQFAALHSPAELVIAGVAGDDAFALDWMKWLPHTTSDFSPIEAPHLASNGAEASALVSAIEEVLDERSPTTPGIADGPKPLPAILLVVADDAPIERARLVQIAERGPDVHIHVVWHALSKQRLPAACRIFIETDPAATFQFAGIVPKGEGVPDLEVETISDDAIAALARRLAPVNDSGVRTDDQSDLPRSVSFLELAGVDLGVDPAAVIESWRANNALPPEPGAPKLRRPNTLRAIVGQGSAGTLHLDLRTQGPHALVGGTTGAGKSEFLQSWVLGMAAMHSPSRVTFLFVDYKGGSAFSSCINLPHCVGLVTDLSPHLVRRALVSLNAELRYREHVLNAKKAKDLFELEKQNDPETPPSLIIVVDEFAALVHEVPEFVDGVVNVAQRGRSLGLNLILATQRPAGVIKDNLRANTNLRVALRMADEADSDDVVGSKLAATFDPSLPGRGVVKTGPGRLNTFQSAYAGGTTSGEPPRPTLDIRDLVFGSGAVWEEPVDDSPVTDDSIPSDIDRVVATIGLATEHAGIAAPRKPWLPELAPTYSLLRVPSRRTDSELVFGVCDNPAQQTQPEISFRPDVSGNMAVYGTGGSGKSAFLRTIAIAAAQGYARGGPTHVYGLDFGSRGLQMLSDLPHVGAIVNGDDDERVQRMLRMLRETVDERAERYASVDAGSIVEYRERANRPEEPRILVLVDNVGAFRTSYEATAALSRYWETFQSLTADGRSTGIHFILSADRPGAISTSLSSAIQQRLVLRLSNEMDFVILNVSSDGFTQNSPPGRGFLDGFEVQVAVLGGVSNEALQAEEIRKLTRAMLKAGIPPAPTVARLPELVTSSEVPDEVNGLPVLGIWDETLEPIGFAPVGTFVVTGPPLSGRTSTVAHLAQQLRRARPKMKLVYLGQRRSPLHTAVDWDITATGVEAIEELAAELQAEMTDPAPGSWGIIIEGVSDLLNTSAEQPLQTLVKMARTNEQFVIAEGETSSMMGSWPLLQAVKVSRAGFALQPDQGDGDSLFKTSFPRVSRKDFPLGRGLYVTGGTTFRVQVVAPD